VRLTQGGKGSYREADRADRLRCEVVVERAGTVLSAVIVSLEVREEVVRGSGTNKKTYRHPYFTSEVRLAPGAPGVYRGDLPLPAPGSAPYSFTAPSNELRWEVTVDVDVTDWPDWRERFVLDARPAA